MADSDPNYTTVDKFNDEIKKWTISIKQNLRSNVKAKTKGDSKEWKNRVSKKLEQSIVYGLRKRNGETERIRFSFERHGVFLHYGVGRSHVRNGNSVTRGVRSGSKEAIVKNGTVNRKPIDWFDSELDKNMSSLADIAVEYHGDKALQQILDINKKAKIDGK